MPQDESGLQDSSPLVRTYCDWMQELYRTRDHPARGQPGRYRELDLVFGLHFGFGIGLGGGVLIFHPVLEGANTVAQTLTQLGQPLGSEKDQRDDKDQQQVHRLK